MDKKYEDILTDDYWKRLPEFDLYMDQVVSFMERYLEPVKVTDNEKLITSSMINNYTKDGLVPRPNRKKYSRKHLAALAMICMLKSVLPITDIKQLLSYFKTSDEEFKELYSVFCKAQEAAFDVANEDSENIRQDKKQRYYRAVELVALSNAYRIAAQKLLKQKDED